MTDLPISSGFYEVSPHSDIDNPYLVWVYVNPRGAVCMRMPKRSGAVRIDHKFLRRHHLKGPIPVPDRMPAEI